MMSVDPFQIPHRNLRRPMYCDVGWDPPPYGGGLPDARHGDPFSVLGAHVDASGQRWLRCFQPGARAALAVDVSSGQPLSLLTQLHPDGVFEGMLGSAAGTHRLQFTWADGSVSTVDDPYRFPPVLGELDVWLLAEGRHKRLFEKLGAHALTLDGVAGTAFAVWAPNARRVAVVGDFNHWDERRHPMRLRRECGVWEIFLPHVTPGDLYKYEVKGADGALHLKADPIALRAELRPQTASVVQALLPVVPPSDARRAANGFAAPISIYEVHLGSWRRVPEEGDRWLTYRELADQLVPYARDIRSVLEGGGP